MLRDSVPTEDEVGQLAVAHGATVRRSGHGLPRRGRGPDPQRELPNPTTPGRTATCVIHDAACSDALATACTTQRPPSECRKLPTSRQRTAPCITPQQSRRAAALHERRRHSRGNFRPPRGNKTSVQTLPPGCAKLRAAAQRARQPQQRSEACARGMVSVARRKLPAHLYAVVPALMWAEASPVPVPMWRR
jgi:hypothetical protein